MSEAKHTPGPWKVGGFFEGAGPVVSNPDARPCYDVAYIAAGNPDTQANARLIAAAPELLEALKGLMEWWGVYDVAVSKAQFPSQADHFMERGAKARAAIAKAEGGDQ